MRPQRKTFAVNLLLEGETVLVVGGGRVGLRKTKALLDAGAKVRLVCPQALPELQALPLTWRQKPFTADDLERCKLAIACTDDRHVNRAILEAARAAKIPCCCADGHWAASDFIVPATLRTDDLLIAVSTNGQSCRTAKEVKDSLARNLAHYSPGTLFIHGIDSAIPTLNKALVATRLSFLNGLYGWAFLTTCNRTELLAWASPELIESGLLEHALHLPSGAYRFTGEEAFRHLSFVLAGMRAQMVGEFHIIGQVRDAIEEARTQGWCNGALLNAYAEALRRAQSIRAAVTPHLPKIALEELALAGATGKVVIAGTGKLGRAAIQHAHELGLQVTVLYHRTPLEGETCLPLTEWRSAIEGANRFVSCLTSPTPLFNAADLPLPAYDLGAPRNIAGDEGVYDLDALRNDYLRETGCLESIFAAADAAYQEVTHA